MHDVHHHLCHVAIELHLHRVLVPALQVARKVHRTDHGQSVRTFVRLHGFAQVSLGADGVVDGSVGISGEGTSLHLTKKACVAVRTERFVGYEHDALHEGVNHIGSNFFVRHVVMQLIVEHLAAAS